MAGFTYNSITERGRILLSAAQVGATFEATKIVMGSGNIPSGYTAATMTAVVAPVIELEINKKKRAGDGTVTFGGAFSNETITEAFYFREFALFARVQYADGTYSDEVLYSYGNAGGNADLIPAYSTSTVVEKQMDLVVYVGNETQVNLTVASGLYNTHADNHAAGGEDPLTPAMIGALPMIEATTADYDMDAIIASGAHCAMYKTSANTLGTPYKKGVTNLQSCTILSWNNGQNRGQQVAFAAGRNDVFVRCLSVNGLEGWTRFATTDYAVNKAGDTMDGSLVTKVFIAAQNATTGRQARMIPHSNTTRDADFVNYLSDTQYIGLRLGTEADSLANAARLIRMADGAWSSYKIYHEGNAPAVVATAELV